MQTPVDDNDDDEDMMRDLDRRVVILETRFDTLVPTLSTKTDLAALEIRMEKSFTSMHRRLAAMCISLVLGFGGLSLTLMNTVQANSQATNQAITRLTAQVEKISAAPQRNEPHISR